MCAQVSKSVKHRGSSDNAATSEACGIQEPHATLSVLHVSVKRMSQRGYRIRVGTLYTVVGASWQNCFFDAQGVTAFR